MLVGSNHSAVNAVHLPVQQSPPIGLSLQRFEYLKQRSVTPPSIESSGDRPPRPMFNGQIPPRRTCAHQPEDRIEKPPMADRRPSGQGFFRRQQRFYARPLLVREAMSWHSLKKFLRIPPLSFKPL